MAIFALPLLAMCAAPALAQQSDDGPKRNAVCMTKTMENGGVFPIVLPKTDEAAMVAKGFVKEPCRKAFGTRRKVAEWRDFICRIASNGSEERQEQFEQRWGERPAVLCGMAELTSSQWQRTRRQR